MAKSIPRIIPVLVFKSVLAFWAASQSSSLSSLLGPYLLEQGGEQQRVLPTVLLPVLTTADEAGNNNNNKRPTTADANARPPPRLTVFYNIYIHPKDKDPFQIVTEQMQMLGSSYAAASQKAVGHNLTVYYNTVGGDQMWNDTRMEQLCLQQEHPLICVHRNHYAKAYEEVTLQDLHDHCTTTHSSSHSETTTNTTAAGRNGIQQQQKQPQQHVIYMHNKGSYSRNRFNPVWRKHLTEAVVGQECLANLASQQCSTCTLQFLPIFAPMHAGNFFAAQCDYIARLVGPVPYMARAEQIAVSKPQDNLQTFMFHRGISLIGVGRYTMEEWAATHPSLVPCDLSQSNDVRFWWFMPTGDNSDRFRHVFHRGVRHHLSDPDWHMVDETKSDIVRQSMAKRIREQHLLPGLLYKWHQLYPGQFPADDSWVWKFYPDGMYWKNKVQQSQNGLLALEQAWKEIPLQSSQ